MKPGEYLDAARIAAKMPSDYALAKEIAVPRQRISDIRAGIRPMPNYAAVRLAVILGKDPAEVIADLECQRETNAEKKRFWADFLSRAKVPAIAVMAALSFTAQPLPAEARANAGGDNLYYVNYDCHVEEAVHGDRR